MLDNIIQKVKCFYKLESGRSVLYNFMQNVEFAN